MALGKRGRRVLQVGGAIVLSLILIWFSLPLWLPWVLRPLAGRVGARYDRYERLGYSHFAVSQFTLTNRSTQIQAQRVELLVPTVWLWRCLAEPGTAGESFLRARGWKYAAVPSRGPGKGISETGHDALSLLRSLRRWAPLVRLSQGTIHSGDKDIPVPELSWAGGELRGETQLPEPLELRLSLVHGPPFEAEIHSEPLRLQSSLQIGTNALGFTVTGSGTWRSNRFDLGAQFGPRGDLPVSARFGAANFRVPGALVRLPQYGEISGSATARWEQGSFALDLRAAGRPAAGETNLPPLDLVLRATGDTNAATIQSAVISSPWLEAELSRGAKIYFNGPFVRAPAAFRVKADLARQPWFPLEGTVAGEAEIEPSTNQLPAGRFQFSGSNIGNSNLVARSFAVVGRWQWPWIEMRQLKADFDDGSVLSAGGKMDLQKKLIENGTLNYRGPLGARWLPSGYSFETAALSGIFSGPLQALTHSGELHVTNAITPYLQPLQLRAAWSAQGETFSRVGIEAESTNLSVSLQGRGRVAGQNLEIELQSLSLSTNRAPALSLAAPCRITSSGHHGPRSEWDLAVSPLRLKGPGGEIQAQANLNWPREGQIGLSLRNITSSLFSLFSRQQMPPLSIRSLDLTGAWTNAPAEFQLRLSAEAQPTNVFRHPQPVQSFPGATNLTLPILLELEAKGNAHGLAISNLVITSQNSNVVSARGFLPLTISPAAPTNLFHADRAQAVAFSAAVHPEAFFWKELAAQTGLTLEQPQLTATVSGNWPALQGRIDLSARQILVHTARTNLPSLEQLQVRLLLDRDRARLTRGQLLVQGQAVDLTGELPLAAGFWNQVKSRPVPDWQQARLRLQIPRAQFAAFQPLFPTILTPVGDLAVDVSLAPGLKLDGELRVENGRTRPLGNAGPLRKINVTLRFQDRALKLEHASADLGGSALILTGQADLSGTNWLHGDLPPFVLSLQGQSVPLAREPEFILRSDLLLGITKTNGAPPVISGSVGLRDSYYLSDLQALVPGKVATPANRPPYFSVTESGLEDWRLALDVRGERFLKVRSPLFADEVSTTLKVIGTLKDPIALGDLKIDSGVVRFPFGSLQVQQGLIVLASQDPYHPQITLTSASKQYGYEIRMEVTGPVDNPVIQFTSTPPLSSEQILLMVTAGQMPQGTFSLTPQQRAQTMALFLGRDLLTKLGFGDQAQQRLTIRSGEEISEQGRPTYHVEYKLTERWSLEGEYDRFGDFNAGFKWRVYSK